MSQNINETVKQRFCMDYELDINVFREPYFSERLQLAGYENIYKDYIEMIKECFGDAQAYLKYYDQVEDTMIKHVKESPAFVHFANESISKFAKTNFTLVAMCSNCIMLEKLLSD